MKKMVIVVIAWNLASLSLCASAQQEGQDWKKKIDQATVAGIHQLLAEDSKDEPAAGRLATLGAYALPSMCAVLWGLPQARAVAEDDAAPVPADLSEAGRTAILQAIEKMGSDAISKFMKSVIASEGATLEERVRCMQLLMRVGKSADVRLLIEVSNSIDDIDLAFPATGNSFRRALTEILKRDRTAFRELATQWRSVKASTRLLAIRGASDTRSKQAIALFEGLLGGGVSQDAAVVRALDNLNGEFRQTLSRPTISRLRRFLETGPPKLKKNCAAALAAAHDVHSFPALVNLLKQENRSLAYVSLKALRTMSGVDLPPDAEKWHTWHDAQLEWFKSESEKLCDKLSSERPEEVLAAIRALSGRRLFRTDLAEELKALLKNKNIGIQQAACMALGRLGEPTCTLELATMLQPSRPEPVRQAAWKALQAITRLKLPPDHKAWEAALKK